jgi:mono/diheme cytochrome c family protein
MTFGSACGRSLLTILFSIGCAAAALAWQTSPGDAKQEEAWTDVQSARVQELFRTHCTECHGVGSEVQAGLSLNTREGMLTGGDSGAAIDLESPGDSLLLSAIRYESYEMPPQGQLPDEDIEAIAQWLQAGAPWPGGPLVDPATDPEPGGIVPPPVNEETRAWWAWQPVQRPEVPAVSSATANPIDAFILKKLDDAGLKPNPPADRRDLIRRATYDLIGLPPTPEEVAAFVNDSSPDAWEQLIDRLMASPHYGEKWGRHWLDLVRYGESNSYERDDTKPFVWRYRDYVIQAFNNDKPYDEFIVEQLAGDELDDVTPERIIATGYYRLGIWDDEPADPLQAWYDDMDDVLATTSQAMLGLTVNCARCHDHKIDPIPQTDYYRLLAFFRNVRRYGVRAPETVADASLREIAPQSERERHRQEVEAWEGEIRKNRRELRKIETIVRKDFSPVEQEEFRDHFKRVALVRKRAGGLITEEQADLYEKLMDERRRLEENPPAALESALCVKETGGEPLETFVLVRGNPHAPSEQVEPGFPSVLSAPEPEIQPPASGDSTGRRLALARWIASPDNPLTSRVMANRLWQYHFGRGLVRTSSDFGFQGSPPTHPELLDWLASELVDGGWRLKRMHRLIMTSEAYQRSSADQADAYAADPVNDSFWRFDMRRLTAEEVRDSILAVNRTLNVDEMFGPSVYPVIPDEVLHGQSMPGANWHTSTGGDLTRRSIYVHIKRSLPVPLLDAFDAAEPDSPCPVRFHTVQPTQALALLNSQFIHDQAAAFAESLQEAAPGDTQRQVEIALERVTQRAPTDAEVQRGETFIRELADSGIEPDTALQHFCLVALNLNEFLFLD